MVILMENNNHSVELDKPVLFHIALLRCVLSCHHQLCPLYSQNKLLQREEKILVGCIELPQDKDLVVSKAFL